MNAFEDVDDVLAGLDRGQAISEEALAHLHAYVTTTYGVPLPYDYVAFLRATNGVDGHLENGIPICLWMGELLRQINVDSETERWMPGYFVIGSDTGDTLYGIDLRPDAPAGRYVESDDVGLGWDYVFWRGDSLLELLRHVSSPLPEVRHRGIGGSLRSTWRRLRRPGR